MRCEWRVVERQSELVCMVSWYHAAEVTLGWEERKQPDWFKGKGDQSRSRNTFFHLTTSSEQKKQQILAARE